MNILPCLFAAVALLCALHPSLSVGDNLAAKGPASSLFDFRITRHSRLQRKHGLEIVGDEATDGGRKEGASNSELHGSRAQGTTTAAESVPAPTPTRYGLTSLRDFFRSSSFNGIKNDDSNSEGTEMKPIGTFYQASPLKAATAGMLSAAKPPVVTPVTREPIEQPTRSGCAGRRCFAVPSVEIPSHPFYNRPLAPLSTPSGFMNIKKIIHKPDVPGYSTSSDSDDECVHMGSCGGYPPSNWQQNDGHRPHTESPLATASPTKLTKPSLDSMTAKHTPHDSTLGTAVGPVIAQTQTNVRHEPGVATPQVLPTAADRDTDGLSRHEEKQHAPPLEGATRPPAHTPPFTKSPIDGDRKVETKVLPKIAEWNAQADFGHQQWVDTKARPQQLPKKTRRPQGKVPILPPLDLDRYFTMSDEAIYTARPRDRAEPEAIERQIRMPNSASEVSRYGVPYPWLYGRSKTEIAQELARATRDPSVVRPGPRTSWEALHPLDPERRCREAALTAFKEEFKEHNFDKSPEMLRCAKLAGIVHRLPLVSLPWDVASCAGFVAQTLKACFVPHHVRDKVADAVQDAIQRAYMESDVKYRLRNERQAQHKAQLPELAEVWHQEWIAQSLRHAQEERERFRNKLAASLHGALLAGESLDRDLAAKASASTMLQPPRPQTFTRGESKSFSSTRPRPALPSHPEASSRRLAPSQRELAIHAVHDWATKEREGARHALDMSPALSSLSESSRRSLRKGRSHRQRAESFDEQSIG